MYPELQGKVAVITGAGRRNGLGEAMAHRLAQEGCRVLLTDIGHAEGEHMPETAVGTASQMRQIVDEIRRGGGDAAAFDCNVLNPGEVEGAAAFATERFGRLDICK